MVAIDVVSKRTWVIAVGGVAVSAAFLVLVRIGLNIAGATGALIANLPSLVTAALACAVTLWASSRFRTGEGLRRQWFLIGCGVGALFIGDSTYAWIEVVKAQEVPFPSLADFFYLISFPVLAAGLFVALLSFRRSLDLRRPVIISAIFTGAITAVLWASVFWPILQDTEATLVEKLLGIFYPIGDLGLLVFPALALAIALSQFGVGRLAWPWWWVVGGLGLIATADTLFALAENAGTYTTGSLIDLGWWLGYVAIAVGASLLIDVQRPSARGGQS